jgi:ABC-type branched-subunit amino acid transport system permease subunit
MNIQALIASSIDGLMLGVVYGLMAMGLTLIFGVMKVINLSHGPFIVMGMFAVLVMSQNLGIHLHGLGRRRPAWACDRDCSVLCRGPSVVNCAPCWRRFR